MPSPPLFDLALLDVSRVVLDLPRIREILPHRDHLALVDGICYHDPITHAMAGWRDVKAGEFWESGHFPGHPLYPGVMIVEASAQVSLLAYKLGRPDIMNRLVVFGGIDEVRFRGGVRPGDRVHLMIRMTEMSRRAARAQTQGWVNGKLIYEGQVLAIVT